jgi:hypothetical protein
MPNSARTASNNKAPPHQALAIQAAEGVEFSAISKKSWLFAAFSVPKECDNE